MRKHQSKIGSQEVTGTTITFKLTINFITCFHNSSIIRVGPLSFGPPQAKLLGGLDSPSPQGSTPMPTRFVGDVKSVFGASLGNTGGLSIDHCQNQLWPQFR